MREREKERGRERERAGVIVNMATVGNVIPKCTCQAGDSGMRVRFLRRWTKNNWSFNANYLRNTMTEFC